MYQQSFYKNLDRDQIFEAIKKEGFSPMYFSVPAGFVYPKHKHPEIKLLVFLDGNMDVDVEGEIFRCGPRDRLLIPGNKEHAATVSMRGCNFFWSEKLPT